MSRAFSIGAFLLLSSAGFGSASQIAVSGRAYSDSACRYYTSSSADFQITHFAVGSRPKVLYHFSGDKQGKSVSRVAAGDALMKVRKDGSGLAEFTARVDERSGYFYKAVGFRIQWQEADGKIRETNEFTVDIPSRECQPGDFKPLEIH